MDVVHEYPDLTVHLTLFHATIREGIPQKLEHNDIRWITVNEIDQYEFLSGRRGDFEEDKGCLLKPITSSSETESRRSSNRTVKYASAKHFLTRTTYLLDQKLDEELAEYQESKSLEELADLLEVLQAVVKARGWTLEELEQVRAEKATKRGGFEKRSFEGSTGGLLNGHYTGKRTIIRFG